MVDITQVPIGTLLEHISGNIWQIVGIGLTPSGHRLEVYGNLISSPILKQDIAHMQGLTLEQELANWSYYEDEFCGWVRDVREGRVSS